MPSLSDALVCRRAMTALSLICAVVGCAPLASSQTAPQPVPSNWLSDGRLIAKDYNFSLDSPNPNANWTYTRLADIDGSKATAFVVESPKEGRFVVGIWDVASSVDSGITKKLVDSFTDGMKKTMPKDWQIDDAVIESSDVPLKNSLKISIAIHRAGATNLYSHGYLVPSDRTYLIFDFSPTTVESPQFIRFASSFALLSPPKAKSNLGYSAYHWLIVAALIGYIWLLVKIARPRPVTGPVTASKSSLAIQTVAARMCSYLFGILTFISIVMHANPKNGIQNTYTPGDKSEAIAHFTGYLVGLLGVPLFFALSMRWSRNVANKKKVLNPPPVTEERS
jgi:hypothetical protein